MRNCSSRRLGFIIIGSRCGADDDVHASDLIDIVVIDLGKHDLFLQAHRVVATTVEALRRNTTKIANPRQRDVDQAIKKLVHALTAHGDLTADRHAFAQLEVGDRLSGPARV